MGVPFLAHKKIKRLHPGEFGGGIAGNVFKIFVPAQKVSGLIIQIKNSRQTVQADFRKIPFIPNRFLGLLTFCDVTNVALDYFFFHPLDTRC